MINKFAFALSVTTICANAFPACAMFNDDKLDTENQRKIPVKRIINYKNMSRSVESIKVETPLRFSFGIKARMTSFQTTPIKPVSMTLGITRAWTPLRPNIGMPTIMTGIQKIGLNRFIRSINPLVGKNERFEGFAVKPPLRRIDFFYKTGRFVPRLNLVPTAPVNVIQLPEPSKMPVLSSILIPTLFLKEPPTVAINMPKVGINKELEVASLNSQPTVSSQPLTLTVEKDVKSISSEPPAPAISQVQVVISQNVSTQNLGERENTISSPVQSLRETEDFSQTPIKALKTAVESGIHKASAVLEESKAVVIESVAKIVFEGSLQVNTPRLTMPKVKQDDIIVQVEPETSRPVQIKSRADRESFGNQVENLNRSLLDTRTDVDVLIQRRKTSNFTVKHDAEKFQSQEEEYQALVRQVAGFEEKLTSLQSTLERDYKEDSEYFSEHRNKLESLKDFLLQLTNDLVLNQSKLARDKSSQPQPQEIVLDSKLDALVKNISANMEILEKDLRKIKEESYRDYFPSYFPVKDGIKLESQKHKVEDLAKVVKNIEEDFSSIHSYLENNAGFHPDTLIEQRNTVDGRIEKIKNDFGYCSECLARISAEIERLEAVPVAIVTGSQTTSLETPTTTASEPLSLTTSSSVQSPLTESQRAEAKIQTVYIQGKATNISIKDSEEDKSKGKGASGNTFSTSGVAASVAPLDLTASTQKPQETAPVAVVTGGQTTSTTTASESPLMASQDAGSRTQTVFFSGKPMHISIKDPEEYKSKGLSTSGITNSVPIPSIEAPLSTSQVSVNNSYAYMAPEVVDELLSMGDSLNASHLTENKKQLIVVSAYLRASLQGKWLSDVTPKESVIEELETLKSDIKSFNPSTIVNPDNPEYESAIKTWFDYIKTWASLIIGRKS